MQENTCFCFFFFYFIHSFLQNTHISLSILHIYSIKYSKPSHYQPNQYPRIKIIKTHSSKSSKPSHHQPDQYPATINNQYPALHHQPTQPLAFIINPSIKIPTTINLINTHGSKSSKPTHQNHQTHQLKPSPIGNGESIDQIIKTIGDQQRREQRRSVEEESVR